MEAHDSHVTGKSLATMALPGWSEITARKIDQEVRANPMVPFMVNAVRRSRTQFFVSSSGTESHHV